MNSPNVSYVIDKKNNIVEVGDGWIEAALAGHAEKTLNDGCVIGQPIENYVCSDTTQMYYDAVYKLCRLKKETITREYRCDTTTHQRYMRVTLTPLNDGHIRLFHETLREEPFANEVITHEHRRNKNINKSQIYKRCSVCNRLQKPGENQWHLPETLAEKQKVKLNVIHTICMDCKNKDWTKV